MPHDFDSDDLSLDYFEEDYDLVEIEVGIKCNACFGYGVDRNGEADCMVCDGYGQVYIDD